MLQNNNYILLCQQLRLTPYQAFVLERNGRKYNFHRIIKRGNVLYVPYNSDDRASVREYAAHMLFGPRADLIGPDRMLVVNRRGIRINPSGFFSIANNGLRYYSDNMGNRIERNVFARFSR